MPQKPTDARFEDLDLIDLHDRGFAYAVRRSARYRNLRSSPEDFVADGFCQLFAKWEGPTQCAAIAFLCMSIKNKIHAEGVSGEARTTDTGLPGDVIELRDPQLNPEQQFIFRKRTEELLAYISKHDKECATLAKLYLRLGKTKMKKISVMMGVDIDHAYYVKRKLEKIVQNYTEGEVDPDSSTAA